MFFRRFWVPVALGLATLGLNFWQLDQPARLMSDEWYFVQDAEQYVLGRPYADVHPPLGKLQLGLMFTWFGSSPMTWRAGNALLGAIIVVVAWWCVWRLTRRAGAAHAAALLVAVSGVLTTESRSGLINLPYIFYGLLLAAFVLAALQSPRPRRWIIAAGTAAGLALSVKWLAFAYVIPALALWFFPTWFGFERSPVRSAAWRIESIGWLVLWPVALYGLTFAWHFAWLGQPIDIIGAHAQMLNHHLGTQTGHPYRLAWWAWPYLGQPFPYWSEIERGRLAMAWSLPNPVLWVVGWLTLGWGLLWRRRAPAVRWLAVASISSWIPFIFIQRDMFMYHVVPMTLWLAMLTGIVVSAWWSRRRLVVAAILSFVIASFVWFLPWYLHLPMSEAQHRLRQWLPTWKLGQPELEAIRGGQVGIPRRETDRFEAPE